MLLQQAESWLEVYRTNTFHLNTTKDVFVTLKIVDVETGPRREWTPSASIV
jgi:hypothetical protein